MNIDFSLEQAVTKRYSVRNYSEQEIQPDQKDEIEHFIASLINPFGKKVDFHYLDKDSIGNEKKFPLELSMWEINILNYVLLLRLFFKKRS